MCFNRFFKNHNPFPKELKWYNDGIGIGIWSFRLSNIPKNFNKLAIVTLSTSAFFIKNAMAYTGFFYDPNKVSIYKYDVTCDPDASAYNLLINIPTNCNTSVITKPITGNYTVIYTGSGCVSRGPRGACLTEASVLLSRLLSNPEQPMESDCIIPGLEDILNPKYDSNTAIIVLGTLGGLLSISLLGILVFKINNYRKNKAYRALQDTIPDIEAVEEKNLPVTYQNLRLTTP